MPVDVSVVVCTFNRADMLADTLESWIGVGRGGAGVELVVVDNASTDDTPAVVQRFEPSFPCPLRYVFEPRSGLSYARNRGIDEAAGAIIAFVDDDVYFEPEWLRELLAAFRDHPEAHCVGGRSVPAFEAEQPPWLTESMLKFYGSTLSGAEDRFMEYPEHPFGVNMAFRREVFEIVGPFKGDLGRVGKRLLSNEEKDLFYRIDAAGLAVFYASRAVLKHRVPPERLRQDWLLRRAYWQGISNVVFDRYVRQPSKLAMCRDLARNLKRLMLGPGRGTVRSLYGGSFEAKLGAYRQLGIVRQSLAELFQLPR